MYYDELVNYVNIGNKFDYLAGFESNEVAEQTTAAAQTIKSMLPAMMCPQVEMGVAMATAAIENMPTHLPIGYGLVMDMALAADPMLV